MGENQNFVGVYAPPNWLLASDHLEGEDESPIFCPQSENSSELGFILQSSPQGQAEAGISPRSHLTELLPLPSPVSPLPL